MDSKPDSVQSCPQCFSSLPSPSQRGAQGGRDRNLGVWRRGGVGNTEHSEPQEATFLPQSEPGWRQERSIQVLGKEWAVSRSLDLCQPGHYTRTHEFLSCPSKNWVSDNLSTMTTTAHVPGVPGRGCSLCLKLQEKSQFPTSRPPHVPSQEPSPSPVPWEG